MATSALPRVQRGERTAWRVGSIQRIAGSALAILFTFLPLALLYRQHGPRSAAFPSEQLVYVPLLSDARPADVEEATPVAAPRKREPEKKRRARRPSESSPYPAPATPQPFARAGPPAPNAEPVPRPPPRIASAPLRLDASVIRAAVHSGKSQVMRLAETSGAYFGDDPVSQTDKLGSAVARTAKPDCIRPGGSLLSIFVIAYEVARSKCSNNVP